MQNYRLNEFFNEQQMSGVRGVDVVEFNGSTRIIALNKNEIRVFEKDQVISSIPMNETFDLIKAIPDHPNLYFLAKNKIFILNPGDEFEELENSDSEFAIFDVQKNKIVERYPINDSRIYSITAWIDESGNIKLSGVIGNYYRKQPRAFLSFKKSYADIFDLELEVTASYLLSTSSDEEILTASCNGHLLMFLDNFHQTRFFDLNTGNCFLEYVDQKKYFWPQGLKFWYGRLDFFDKDLFGIHFKDQSLVFNINTNLEYEYDIDLSGSHLPVRIINNHQVLVQNHSSIGYVKRSNSIDYIMTD